MGKPTGFIEYRRELPLERRCLERIQDWREFHTVASGDQLALQSARCMDCGTPYCHAGIMLAGMASGCPINNLIPEWADLMYRGHWLAAFERLQMTNNFPEFTGRVCPAPCEGSCTAGLNGDPITIKCIELSIIDRAFAEGWIKPNPPARRSGRKIAVVGSGPAGLACADQLNKVGHQVTVYERSDRLGGLLMYGIPNMKLDKEVVKRRVNLMRAEGVQFVVNTDVGKSCSTDQLQKKYDAVVLCCGATKPRDLVVKGREYQGVHFAVDFLSMNTKSLLDSKLEDGHYVSAKGKDVIIIGGGDTGTDCVATALRHGCNSVTQFEIRPSLPSQRGSNNPWPQWPNVNRIDYGQEEAIVVYGEDPRVFSIMTKEFIADGEGKVSGVKTGDVKWIHGDDGRFIAQEIPGTTKVWPAQVVLLALGFLGPEDTLPEQLNLKRDGRSNIQTKDGRFSTNQPGIFVAGDMRRGQSLVVWAIHEGRAVAAEVDQYLTA